MEHVILKCLAKEPTERYPTGDALHTELVQLLGRATTPDGDPTVVMATPAASRAALEITSPTRRRAPLARSVAVLAGLLILIATGFGLNARARQKEEARAAQPDSTLAARRTNAPPLALMTPVITDSARRDSIADSAARAAAVARVPRHPAPTRESQRVLRVIGPADASISVDGTIVGRGTWHSDSITTGVHHVLVSVSSAPGCTAARERKDVQVAPTGTTTANFSPRDCGAVTLDVAPVGAHFSFAHGGSEVASGTVPSESPLQLPEGTYTLHVSAKYCADYSGAVSVAAGTASTQRVRLICQ